MSLRDRLARRNSHTLQQISPALIRPQSSMESFVGIQQEEFESRRAQRLVEKAIRVETRYEKRKRK